MTNIFTIETIEHSFDDVPWVGDSEEFKTWTAANRRVDQLKSFPRDNEVTCYILNNGEVISAYSLPRKL